MIAERMAREAAAMGNKPGYLFGVIPLDWNASAPFAMQSCSPVAKNIPSLMPGSGKAGGLGDKFLQACMGVSEDLKKVASSAGVMYSGEVTNGAPVINNAPVMSGGSSQMEV